MPILGDVFGGIVSRAVWELSKVIGSYFGLRDYVLFRFRSVTHEDEPYEIRAFDPITNEQGDKKFWNAVQSGAVSIGSAVLLRDFKISPWFPRKPGVYWTRQAQKARDLANRRHVAEHNADGVVFDRLGKALMTELGGLGSVNLRKQRTNALITATASGDTDQGIPLICTKRVWDEIQSAFRTDRIIEADLKGILCQIPDEVESTLLNPQGIAKVALRVGSILNLNLMISRVPIIVRPWTVFETYDPDDPFAFTYVTHTLGQNDIHESVALMRRYIVEHQGSTIVTEFDEEVNFLGAHFPLRESLQSNFRLSAIGAYCQQLVLRYQ